MTYLTPAPGKPAVQSVTIWGALASLAGLMLPPLLAHLHVTPPDAQEAARDIGGILTACGSLVAIYGRARATTPITTIVNKET